MTVMDRFDILPAIFFLKSRAECDNALKLCNADLCLADMRGASLCNADLNGAKISFRDRVVVVRFEEQPR